MIENFPFEVKGNKTAPWNDKLFKVSQTLKKLDEKRQMIFHKFVMKAMFLCKRVRPDIEPEVCF